MTRYINDMATNATHFAFDECHKIYLLDDEEDIQHYKDLSYHIYPIEELPTTWISTCPLRFILSADLDISYVDQFEPAKFEGWNLAPSLIDELNILANEQIEANAS